MLTQTDDIRAIDDEDLLIFDVSDDALERAAPIIGGVASVVTLNFGKREAEEDWGSPHWIRSSKIRRASAVKREIE